jgi:EAL domain-containing protein (putative c-di-GMP-specific phosphodiesterase class I)/GGDEF domain-containing protein
MHSVAKAAEHSASELHRILRNDRITPLFQPVVDAMERRIVCHEVFSRGVHPLESPVELFRAAAAAGVLWEAEEVARNSALRRIASLRDASVKTRFYINTSPSSICDPRMTLEYILQSLDSFSLGPEHLGFEIPVPEVKGTKILLMKLKELGTAGINFSLDDFDPSSDAHQKLLGTPSPEYVKLPRGIVHNLGRYNMGQQSIRRAMGVLSEHGSTLVAKGVEDWTELETLLTLGVRVVQGYLVARPETRPPHIQEDFHGGALRALSGIICSGGSAPGREVSTVSTMPVVIEASSKNCDELDSMFRNDQDLDHVVTTHHGTPHGLVTRKGFYLKTGGRFGFSVFQRETLDAVANHDPMVVGDGVRIAEVAEAAMKRESDDVYDPVLVVDWSGALVGTVTVMQLLYAAIDAERRNSGVLDPLTSLPGGVSLQRKLMEAITLKSFFLVATNINGFRAFNHVHGFDQGDRMILLLAEIMARQVKTFVRDAFIGHMGADRFAVVSFTQIPLECLSGICREFDRRSSSLFYTWKEQETGSMELLTGSGVSLRTPLCTVSVAGTGSANFNGDSQPVALVMDAVESLLKKANRLCLSEEKSSLVIDKLLRSIRTSKEAREDAVLEEKAEYSTSS